MECYITYCVKGFLAFNKENELICEKLFPEDEIIKRLADIGNNEIVKEEQEIIEEVSLKYDEIIIETNKRLSDYNNDKLIIKTPILTSNSMLNFILVICTYKKSFFV